jgi:hypothetical protein
VSFGRRSSRRRAEAGRDIGRKLDGHDIAVAVDDAAVVAFAFGDGADALGPGAPRSIILSTIAAFKASHLAPDSGTRADVALGSGLGSIIRFNSSARASSGTCFPKALN